MRSKRSLEKNSEPELNVYTLETVRHYRKIQGKRKLVTSLVLRDRRGEIYARGPTPYFEEELTKFWWKWNEELKIEELPISPEVRRVIASDIAKLKEHGYVRRYVRYGVVIDKRTGKGKYKRIEVYSITPLPRRIKTYIRDFFRKHIPRRTLTLLVYHHAKLETFRLRGERIT